MSKLAIIDGLMEPLREARRGGMPMYGSCAGMIMLADHVEDARHDQETIGGIDMTVRRNAFGRQVDSFEADIARPGARRARPSAPSSSALRGSSRWGPTSRSSPGSPGGGDDGTIVAVRQGPLMATAFHPELTGDVRVHEMFVEMVRTRR